MRKFLSKVLVNEYLSEDDSKLILQVIPSEL